MTLCFKQTYANTATLANLYRSNTKAFLFATTVQNTSCIYLKAKNRPIKNRPKKRVFMRIKESTISKKFLHSFKPKKQRRYHPRLLKILNFKSKRENQFIQIYKHKGERRLEKLGYNKFYEHIPYIKDKLGIKPPVMTQQLEEQLCNLFMEIQCPYAKYCPDDRVNFLNYYYTIYKLCELLWTNAIFSVFSTA